MPGPLERAIESRFDMTVYKRRKRMKKDSSSFDLVRASVNMFVASILIALATSLKLPLSTTYVTFMVAMGTSFSDRAWGRESAVYRITGVITVIGGWFFTAFTAFTVAFIFAIFISWGGLLATIAAIILAIVFVVRTYSIHRKRSKDEEEAEEKEAKLWNGENILAECNDNIATTVISVSKLYYLVIHNLINEDRKKLKKVNQKISELNLQTKNLKKRVFVTLKKLEEDSIETGHYYVQTLDYLREIAHCLSFIADPVYEHIDNNHSPVIPEQAKELKQLNEDIAELFNHILNVLKKGDFQEMDLILRKQTTILETLNRLKKKQIKLIKSETVGTRNSMLVLGLYAESKNLLLYTINMVKAHRDFIVKNSFKS